MCAHRPTIFAVAFLLAAPAARADDLEPFARAIAERPDEARPYEEYATNAIAKGRLDDAIAQLKLGIAKTADFPRGYYLLAAVYKKKQAWADAAVHYRTYMALRPTEHDALYGLGKALEGLDDKKGAIASLKRYVGLEQREKMKAYVDDAKATIARLDPPPAAPADPLALKAQADALKAEGKNDEAAATYRKALAAAASRPELANDLYNGLGNVFFQAKKFNDAAQTFKDATARDPGFALGWYNLAHALRKADRKSEAVDAYRQYMKLKPEDPDPYYGLGTTLKALGDAPGAIFAYRKYIDLEKRPDQQKWVEKARQELAGLEAAQRPAPAPEAGKIGMDEK